VMLAKGGDETWPGRGRSSLDDDRRPASATATVNSARPSLSFFCLDGPRVCRSPFALPQE
jgi:hypothetical protein